METCPHGYFGIGSSVIGRTCEACEANCNACSSASMFTQCTDFEYLHRIAWKRAQVSIPGVALVRLDVLARHARRAVRLAAQLQHVQNAKPQNTFTDIATHSATSAGENDLNTILKLVEEAEGAELNPENADGIRRRNVRDKVALKVCSCLKPFYKAKKITTKVQLFCPTAS